MSDNTVQASYPGWTQNDCVCCAGIQWGGDSPRTCDLCGGSGFVWRSLKGRLADYPGGPFRGSLRSPAPTERRTPDA